MQIGGDARKHVGVVAREMLFGYQKIDHLADGERGAGIQVIVEAHGDVVRGRFGARPLQVQVLAHDELKRADERSFESGDVHFAVALAGVAVADFKERAGRVHGNVERGAGDEVLVIEIARHYPRRSAIEAARAFRRRVAHAAEKGMQRNLDARGKFRHHALLVERNDFYFRVRIIVGQIAAPRPERVVGIRNRQLDRQNFHFQHVADFRAFDVNRTRQNVSARAFVLHLIGDVAQRLLDLLRRQACIFEPLRAVGDQRLNFHRVAGLDAQHRHRLRIVVPPSHRLRRRLQRVRRLRTSLLYEKRERGKQKTSTLEP